MNTTFRYNARMHIAEKRFGTVKSVSRKCHRDVETVRRWCRAGLVKCRLTPAKRGQWLIELDSEGLPVRA